jgi:hypothetical protein
MNLCGVDWFRLMGIDAKRALPSLRGPEGKALKSRLIGIIAVSPTALRALIRKASRDVFPDFQLPYVWPLVRNGEHVAASWRLAVHDVVEMIGHGPKIIEPKMALP